jgi:hypothetical protein
MPEADDYEKVAITIDHNGDLVIVACGFRGLDAWRQGEEERVHLARKQSDPAEPDEGFGRATALAVATDGAGMPIIAVGHDNGRIQLWVVENGEFEALAQTPPLTGSQTRPVRDLVEQMQFYTAVDGTFRLLACKSGYAEILPVSSGDVHPIATLENVDAAAVAYDGQMPVAAVYLQSPVQGMQLFSLADDRFQPLSEPWPTRSQTSRTLDISVEPNGKALVATGGMEGNLEIWQYRSPGTIQSLAMVQLDSYIERLAWTASGDLIVWCRTGVIRIKGPSW